MSGQHQRVAILWIIISFTDETEMEEKAPMPGDHAAIQRDLNGLEK